MNGNLTLLLTTSGQEWQFHIATDNLVVKNGNFTLLLASMVKNGNYTWLLRSSCQEWQFHIAIDI